MLGLGSAVRIPLDLGIHMGVMINESRRNDQPVDIDRSASVSLNPPNLSDLSVFDCDIGQVGRQTGTIDYATTTKHQVIAHLQFLSMETFLIPQFVTLAARRAEDVGKKFLIVAYLLADLGLLT